VQCLLFIVRARVWVCVTVLLISGYRFFYADQRLPDGAPMGNNVDGPAHGEFYAQLVQREKEVPWLATFVKGKGYVKF
jgi:hypothetical protein